MSCSFRTLAVAALALSLVAGHGDAQQSNPQSQPSAPPPANPAQQPAPAGQPQPAATQPPAPTFRTGINFVRVDVIVSDKKGNAVTDLKQGDFQVFEDGKPQTIESFKLVDVDGGVREAIKEPPRQIHTTYEEEFEAAKDDVRLFGIFLDDYHVRLGNSMAVRAPIEKFLETQLGPSDMVAVMYPLEPLADVQFTRNHEAVINAVGQFRGRKFDYTPMNDIEEQYSDYPAETVEQIRNQVSLSAVKALVTRMGSLKEGRKSLILVSEGYSNTLPPQMRDQVAGFSGYGNPDAFNPMAGVNDPNEDTYRFFNQLDLETDLRIVFDAANRNNTAIYGVDPRGLATNEFDVGENVNLEVDSHYLNATMDTIRELAANTDGRAIVNRNDIDTAMKAIVKDSSAYYLIGYNSSQAPQDGKFHAIKVKIDRPGVQLRARKGYWALTAEETAVAKTTLTPKLGPPSPVARALASVEQRARDRVVRTWIGTSRGENGKTRVSFVWEPIGRQPGERASGRPPQRVSLMALGGNGSPYFRGRVPDVALASAKPIPGSVTDADGDGSSAPAPPTGPSRVSFDVPPGKIELHISVEGAGSEVLDSETRTVTVPDLTAHVSLGTPEILRARSVREYQQLKADPNAVPVATRQFMRTDRLIVRVPAYGPGGTSPKVTATLLNRAGKPMGELTVTPAGDSTVNADLPLANLAVGEYLVEVHATGEGADSKELVAFRITG